jgi:hypothetical protein
MKTFVKLFCFFILISGFSFAQNNDFNGKWIMAKEQSNYLDYFRSFTLNFTINKNEIKFKKELGPKRKYEEDITLKTNGKEQTFEVKDWTFASNLFMGLKMPAGKTKKVSALWEKDNILKITENFDIQSSQGSQNTDIIQTFELSGDKNLLTYKIHRNTRDNDQVYIFKKADYNNAYVIKLSDEWEINTRLPEQACLVSIQGIVNKEKPVLYFIYGPDWTFNFTQPLFDFLKKEKYYTFTQLNTLDQALNLFKDKIKGYVLWDKKVRTSIIVAYTLAGLEDGIVISEELLPLMQKYGIKQIDDFRGRFEGKTDYEIYSWAYDKYWERCSRDYIIWIGQEHGQLVKPGIADFGMIQKAFFTDLSFKAKDTLEFSLTNKILSQMKPLSMMMGWHSYKKDLEEESVTITSRHGMRVEPLNTLPNISFMSKIPVTEGFKFKNKNNIQPGKEYLPEKKVYISFVQSDMLGLGAWDKPGRGNIPYAWELNMNWVWLAPVMLEYHYKDATPNDYFIGCLSGPGYLYPKAVPKKQLKEMLNLTKDLMDKVDLNSFEIMDYSEDQMEAANSELTKEVVDLYYETLPNSIGFVNGYFPSYTFASRNGIPMMSFDYYLGPDKPEDDVVDDLKELAKINSNRPYFLLVHVRQSSAISRVKSIYDKLGKEFEILPLDIFLKMAGKNPTFKERYMEKYPKIQY